MDMLIKNSNFLSIQITDSEPAIALSPKRSIVIEEIADSRVKIKPQSDKSILLTITTPETDEPILRTITLDNPQSYCLRSGSSPVSLEGFIYDTRVGLNGSL